MDMDELEIKTMLREIVRLNLETIKFKNDTIKMNEILSLTESLYKKLNIDIDKLKIKLKNREIKSELLIKRKEEERDRLKEEKRRIREERARLRKEEKDKERARLKEEKRRIREERNRLKEEEKEKEREEKRRKREEIIRAKKESILKEIEDKEFKKKTFNDFITKYGKKYECLLKNSIKDDKIKEEILEYIKELKDRNGYMSDLDLYKITHFYLNVYNDTCCDVDKLKEVSEMYKRLLIWIEYTDLIESIEI